MHGVEGVLEDGKNILAVRWAVRYFLAVDLERLGCRVRRQQSVSVAQKV